MSISGQDPSASKSNRLHVVIFRVFFINVMCNSMDSFKMMG